MNSPRTKISPINAEKAPEGSLSRASATGIS
jgi:hypothetical protein